MKASDLAAKLNLSFEDIKPLLVNQRIKSPFPDMDIPQAVCDRLMGVHNRVSEQMGIKQLSGSTGTGTGAELPGSNQGSNQEMPEMRITPAAVKTLAAAEGVTQVTVRNMVSAIRQREQEVFLLAAYQRRRENFQIEELGDAIATMEWYNQRQQDLDNEVNRLNAEQLDLSAIAQTHFGVDLAALENGLGQMDAQRVEAALGKQTSMNQTKQRLQVLQNLISKNSNPTI